MSHFELVVFVYCRDLRGRTIQDYVAETYPPFMQVRIMMMATIILGTLQCIGLVDIKH